MNRCREPTRLTIDDFIDRREAKKFICSRCNQMITNAVFDNFKCNHFRCGNCIPGPNQKFSYGKSSYSKYCNYCDPGKETIGGTLNNKWFMSNVHTNKLKNLMIRCPSMSCDENICLKELTSHQKKHYGKSDKDLLNKCTTCNIMDVSYIAIPITACFVLLGMIRLCQF